MWDYRMSEEERKTLKELAEGLNCLCDEHREVLRKVISDLESSPTESEVAKADREGVNHV